MHREAYAPTSNTDPQPREFYKDAKHWAKIPRPVVLRRMAPDQPLSQRIFYACVLWSACGPHSSDRVVRKDAEGFFEREHGELVPANQKALMDLLQLPSGMKGEFSRKIRGLMRRGILSYDGEAFFLEPDPPPFSPIEEEEKVASIRNWNVAGIVVSTRYFPADPDARIEAETWLDNVSTSYNNGLKRLRTRYRKLLRLGSLERGILISEKTEKLRAAAAVNGSTPQPPPAAADPIPSPPAAATPEEVAVIQDAAAPIPLDVDTSKRIIIRSREHCPDATAQEIGLKVTEKVQEIKHGAEVKSPAGMLVRTVPEKFVGFRRKGPQPQTTERDRNIAYLRQHRAEIEPAEWSEYLALFPELETDST